MVFNKFTRVLISAAIAAMLVGFTATAQEKKEEPKKEVRTAVMKKEQKDLKQATKHKGAMDKKEKKEVKKKAKEEKPL